MVPLASLMLWSEESEWAVVGERCKPAVVVFPIKKRFNTELFIDTKAAVYLVDGRIKGENIMTVVNHWYWLIE